MVEAFQTTFRSSRPDRVVDLLFQGGIHQNWWNANRQKNRFYILNIEEVLGRLNIAHTTMGDFFKKAPEQMKAETSWGKQYPLEFGCHPNQIYPESLLKPKRFDHAVTIIFVLEKYASQSQHEINVYDYLRIIPAQYFVDDLDKIRYDKLAEYYRRLDPVEKGRIFGSAAPESLDDAVAAALSQARKSDLLKQMAWGLCVTRYVAEEVRLFINDRFPDELHLGPVLSSGQEANFSRGGSKNAYPQLRVPRFRRPDQLPPIPLKTEPVELSTNELIALSTTVAMPAAPTIVGLDWSRAQVNGKKVVSGQDDEDSTRVARDSNLAENDAIKEQVSTAGSQPFGETPPVSP